MGVLGALIVLSALSVTSAVSAGVAVAAECEHEAANKRDTNQPPASL